MHLSIDELCEKYRNEDVHTEQVTAFALQLFDATRRWLKLPASDRRLLEAAARLHDVGYTVNAARHPQESRRIVEQEGLAGFTARQRSLIAEIIPLHSGRCRLTASPRALQLAAFLRIADGLDYSHAQTARILDVHREGRVIVVTVESGAFPYARPRADAKADLFRSVFPFDIQFVAPLRERRRLLPATRGLNRWEIVRRLLCIQYKTALANMDGDTPEALHDLRVALRRARLLLRLMDDEWPTRGLQRGLKQVGDALSPARDVDVWIELLSSRHLARAMQDDPAWPGYVRRQQLLRRRPIAVVLGKRFAALRAKMNRFIRTGIPKSPARLEPWKLWINMKLDEELRHVHRLRKLRHSDHPQQLHRLRIALRRARYVAEYAESKKWARRLRKCEQPLARVHDFDTALARKLPAQLAQVLRHLRRKNLQSLSRAWHGLK
jgi:CHAD domain-containing protein